VAEFLVAQRVAEGQHLTGSVQRRSAPLPYGRHALQ